MTLSRQCACGKLLRAGDEYAGKRVKCPQCGRMLLLPAPPAAEPSRPTGGAGLWIVALVLLPFLLGAGALVVLLAVAALFFLASPRPAAAPVNLSADAQPRVDTPTEQRNPEPAPREAPKVPLAPDVKPVPASPAQLESAPRPVENPPRAKMPTVVIDRVEPAEPVAGESLMVLLKGTDPDGDDLRFQYRTDPDADWLDAPGGRVVLTGLQPGMLTLVVRAVNRRDQASLTAERTWVVKSAEKEAGPAYLKDASGVIMLKELPRVTTDNKSGLIRTYRKDLKLTASSTWVGWPPENAVDDDIKTSWFSGKDDAAAKGKTPWLQVNFPEDVPVGRVTILGNRDPAWLVGFTILAGRVTLYDEKGKVLKTVENNGTGNFRDFDFKFNPPVERVRGVRFTSLKDQGNQTVYGDIAIADIQVE
jgi:hypothetical protein